ncbi:endonuclease domain-containing protein [Geodermatophilus sp. SYSU D00705]
MFRTSDVVAAGLLTAAQLRSSAWRRLLRGVYADADLPDSFDVRIAGAGLLLALAGLPAIPQFTVRDADGSFVARVDLAHPEQRVAVEYDGAWHADPTQLVRDRRRLDALVAAGWTVLHVTAADLRDPEALVARVRALLAARNSGGVAL